MKRINIRSVICLWLATTILATAADNQEQSYSNPPDATRPRCYWYWMGGHTTQEGITRDQEAMKRIGIGEGNIGVITTVKPIRSVKADTPLQSSGLFGPGKNFRQPQGIKKII